MSVNDDIKNKYLKMRGVDVDAIIQPKYIPFFPVKGVQLTHYQVQLCKRYKLIEKDFHNLRITYSQTNDTKT